MRAVFLILGCVLCFCAEREEVAVKTNGDLSDSLDVISDSLDILPIDTLDSDSLIVKDSSQSEKVYRFLALGDSYTIGASVEESERWPEQLAEELRNNGLPMDKPEIIAITGWTTNDLLSGIDARALKDTFDLVSLLIGVNNQYRGYDIKQQEKEFKELLEIAKAFAGGDSTRVFIVSIPDYGATPFGQSANPELIGKEIDEYNALNRSIASDYNIRYFDITPISREAKSDPDLVAKDGLHPSGKMYARWVQEIYPWVLDLLKEGGN